jgi:hypothetical protein
MKFHCHWSAIALYPACVSLFSHTVQYSHKWQQILHLLAWEISTTDCAR